MKKNMTAFLIALLPVFGITAQETATTQETSVQEIPAYTELQVWPDAQDSSKEKATLRTFLPDTEKASGRAVLILPGGGYSHLAYEHEGYDWAPFFTEQGIAASVLLYRMPQGNHEEPREDVNQAFEIMRTHANEWHIDTTQIGIMGSSAGGHLAASTATLNPDTRKPAFQILFYPVISMETGITHQGSRDNLLGQVPSEELVNRYCSEKQVTPTTPRAFLILSDDDKAVPPANSIGYYQALHRAGVSASMFIYPSGGHGWGSRENFKYHDEVQMELNRWLQSF